MTQTFKKFTKQVQSAFPHIDLSSKEKMKKFIKRVIPLLILKLGGKIKTNRDGSGSFDKRELNKIKEEINYDSWKKNRIFRRRWEG